jgi:hypothetical protein
VADASHIAHHPESALYTSLPHSVDHVLPPFGLHHISTVNGLVKAYAVVITVDAPPSAIEPAAIRPPPFKAVYVYDAPDSTSRVPLLLLPLTSVHVVPDVVVVGAVSKFIIRPLDTQDPATAGVIVLI